MVFELIEFIIFIVAMYGAALEWVRVKDAKSHNKWDFYGPAAFLLLVISIMFFTGSVNGSDVLSFSSLVCAVAALPLLISLLYTGSLQDAQLAAGDLTYDVGELWWVINDQQKFREAFERLKDDEESCWSEEKEARMGKDGVISEITSARTAKLKFRDYVDNERYVEVVFEFPFEALINSEPAKDEVVEEEKKGWWN